MNLPMLGTEEKTELSKYQVTLVDVSDKTIRPLDYPRLNRFFENVEDRNTFVRLFESTVVKNGGRIAISKGLTHPSFRSFDIIDDKGNKNYELTVYV